MKNIFLLTLVLLFTNSTLGLSQDASPIPFQVNVNYPYLSISQDDLTEAKTLSDLNRTFKSQWIREYINVEISTVQNGETILINGKDSILSPKQKEFLNSINLPANIAVKINYIPENTLKHNQPREEIFTFSVNPKTSASYIDEKGKLEDYLRVNAIAKIPDTTFQGYDLAVVKFTINEKGQVIDASVFQSAKDDAVDRLLLNTICDMPDWEPAQHENGVIVRQEFAFTIGNHDNCNINLLNTTNNKY